MKRINFISLLGALLALGGFFAPWVLVADMPELILNVSEMSWAILPLAMLAALALGASFLPKHWVLPMLMIDGLLGGLLALLAYKDSLALHSEPALMGFWWTFAGMLLITIGAVWKLGFLDTDSRAGKFMRDILPPASVPFLLLLVWEGLTEGLQIPLAFFPKASQVYVALTTSYVTLLKDSARTFFMQVLTGYTIGIFSGLVVGLMVAFSLFLRRGFLPLATAFSAIPIVGLAPVLGRAFGVDWESKAAVAVIVSFFPVVINVVQGLITIDPLKLDLMQSYASSNRDILFKLRIPNALPYVFNALKIASIIVLISVIVAEFLIPGPPEGLGQRISLTARSGRYDVTFAAIAFASAIGILFYSVIALLERRFTSWHSSFREK
jgi:NitT/TauT family transport system permease protein